MSFLLYARDAFVITVLGGWLVLSILAQEANSGLFRSRWGGFNGLLPNYRYFAPFPIMLDPILEYRVFDTDDDPEVWVPMTDFKRSKISWLFNPGLRPQKGLIDMALDILRTPFPKDQFYIPYAYVLVLHAAMPLVKNRMEGSFQFRIMQAPGWQDLVPVVAFVSYIHELPLEPYSCS